MVIELHSELFQNIENRQKITFLLYLFYFDRRYDFFVDLSQIRASPIYVSLTSEDKELIEEYFIRFVNDTIVIDYVITNETKENTFNLDEARIYFEQPLSIVLENSLNDKYFLETIANKFSKRGKAIRRHLAFGWIDIVNAGGCENIINVITEKLAKYAGKPKAPQSYFRCIVIIDSDSTYLGEVKQSRKILKDYLDGLGIKQHVLLKREMENYLPDVVIEEISNNDDYIAAYLKLSPLQKDYFDIEKGFEKNLASYIDGVKDLYSNVPEVDMGHLRKGGLKMPNFKAEFPKLFLSEKITQENLKQRTEHQGEFANELDVILDKVNGLL